MGILFGFEADSITTGTVSTYLSDPSNTSLVFSTPLTADPVSAAVNNVRFSCNAFAPDGELIIHQFRWRSVFRFQIPEAGSVTVFGHFTWLGQTSLLGSPYDGWFPLILGFEGVVSFRVRGNMRVRARDAQNQLKFSRTTASETLVDAFARSSSATAVQEGGLLETYLTLSPPETILPEDTLYVRMEGRADLLLMDGASCVADFSTGGDGVGFNVPMVVVNY
jgi:hypothetical protein